VRWVVFVVDVVSGEGRSEASGHMTFFIVKGDKLPARAIYRPLAELYWESDAKDEVRAE